VFHVATMMVSEDGTKSDGEVLDHKNAGNGLQNEPSASASGLKKKRHIGNDFVHVVFKVRA
jgi:hypothetical protein